MKSCQLFSLRYSSIKLLREDTLIYTFVLFPQEKSFEEIRKEAYIHFLSNNEIEDISSIKIHPLMRNGIVYLYVVNTLNDGWVIISNEKKYTSIIGYNHSGNFSSDSSKMSCSLRLLLNHHMNNIDSLRHGDLSKVY